MKSILVSFTDLDSDVTELEPKWLAAKSAFNIMMRSWVGIHLLVSDSSALPMLMNMLKDTKVRSFTYHFLKSFSLFFCRFHCIHRMQYWIQSLKYWNLIFQERK